MLNRIRQSLADALSRLAGWLIARGEKLSRRAARAGSVQFGAQPLDTLLAPGISNFNQVEIPDLTGAFPKADHWLTNFFLNSIIGPRYTDQWKQAAVTFIFRTQNAIRDYGRARATTLECVASWRPGRPDMRRYFEAVSQWETVILNMQIALDLYRKFIEPNVTLTDDGRRLNQIGNRIKHFGEDIRDEPAGQTDLTLPMWMARTELRTRTAELSFAEIAEQLGDMARAAAIFQNPGL